MKHLLEIFLGITILTIVLTIWPPVKYEPPKKHKYQIDITDADSIKLYDGDRFVGGTKLGEDSIGLIGLIRKDNQ